LDEPTGPPRPLQPDVRRPPRSNRPSATSRQWHPVRSKPAPVVPGPLHKGSVEGKDSVTVERVLPIVGSEGYDLPRDVTRPRSRLSARGERNHRRSVGASPSRVFARQHEDLRAAPTRGKSTQPARSPVDAAPVHEGALGVTSNEVEDMVAPTWTPRRPEPPAERRGGEMPVASWKIGHTDRGRYPYPISPELFRTGSKTIRFHGQAAESKMPRTAPIPLPARSASNTQASAAGAQGHSPWAPR